MCGRVFFVYVLVFFPVDHREHLTHHQGLDLARFPIMVLRYSLSVPDHTLVRLYEVIAWSLRVSHLLFSPPNKRDNKVDMMFPI